jgi:CRP-like cAMP-binding protein
MPESNFIQAIGVKEYLPGEIIVREGDSNEYFYVILDGEVRISQLDKTIRLLSDKDVFGLENYFRGNSYSTTAKARKTSRIATYRCEHIDEIAYSNPSLVKIVLQSAYMQLEQTTSIAEANIPYTEVINLDVREYADGDVIISEDTYGTEIFRLTQTEGGLEVSKKGKAIAVISKTGEYFGEMSFILGEPRSATIRSIGRSVVEVMTVEDGGFEKIIHENPDIADKIIKGLAKRLKEANLMLVKQDS